jgi:dephospho-CoA kinase
MVQGLSEVSKEKVIVGLTGGFGAGKTTVSKLLEERDLCVLNADKLSHEVFEKDNKVGEKIAKAFPEAVSDLGEFDRRKIAEIIFSNPLKKEVLENLIHPYVLQRLRDEINRRSDEIIVLEVPLLFETGWDQMCDFKVTISVDLEVAIERLKERGYSSEEAKQRIESQLSNAEREKKADLIINNNQDLDHLKNEVELIGEKIYSLSKGAK